jgi:hypothetical protein
MLTRYVYLKRVCTVEFGGAAMLGRQFGFVGSCSVRDEGEEWRA